MAKIYTKIDNITLQESEEITETKSENFEYNQINSRIKFFEDQLIYYKKLKAEADKLDISNAVVEDA